MRRTKYKQNKKVQKVAVAIIETLKNEFPILHFYTQKELFDEVYTWLYVFLTDFNYEESQDG